MFPRGLQICSKTLDQTSPPLKLGARRAEMLPRIDAAHRWTLGSTSDQAGLCHRFVSSSSVWERSDVGFAVDEHGKLLRDSVDQLVPAPEDIMNEIKAERWHLNPHFS